MRRFLKTQSIITLASLPTTTFWGYPISYMSFVGNYLAGPLIEALITVGFALICSAFFHFPAEPALFCFEVLTIVWEFFLSLASPTWVVFIRPAYGLTALYALVFFFLTRLSLCASSSQKTLAQWCAIGTLSSALYVWSTVLVPGTVVFENKSGLLTGIYDRKNDKLVLINTGYLNKRMSENQLKRTIRSSLLRRIKQTYGSLPTFTIKDSYLSEYKKEKIKKVLISELSILGESKKASNF